MIQHVTAPAVVLGGFGLGNFGDDLLMLATVRVLQRVYRPDEIVVLLYPGGGRYAARLESNCRYVERRVPLRVAADVAVFGGGTQFYGFGSQQLKRSAWERGIRFCEGLSSGRMTPRGTFGPARESVSRSVKERSSSPFRSVWVPSWTIRRRRVPRPPWDGVDSWRSATNRVWITAGAGLNHARLRGDWGFARSLWNTDGPSLPRGGAGQSGHRGPRLVQVGRRVCPRRCGHPAGSPSAGGRTRRLVFLFDGHEDTTCRRLLRRHRLPVEIWWPQRMRVHEQLEKLQTCDLLVTSRATGPSWAPCSGSPPCA